MKHIHSDILSTIGKTPLIRMGNLFPEAGINIFAKLEALNPGGSIKDRTALSILSRALEEGQLRPGDTVVESSSGNMAIGLAQACLRYGLQLVVVVDPNINQQTVRILETYGAQISRVDTPDEKGGYLTPRIERVQTLLDTIPNSFWPNQYANRFNPMAHYETMSEIVDALDGNLDYLLAATSTCGTIMGCAQYAREAGLKTRIIAVDAVGSVLFGSPPSRRLIPGHGAGRVSPLLDTSLVDRHIHISDEECVWGCRHLLKSEAVLAGGSSGAIVTALSKLYPYMSPDSNCAIILCDRGERYLETVYSDRWVEEKFGAGMLTANPLSEKRILAPAHSIMAGEQVSRAA